MHVSVGLGADQHYFGDNDTGPCDQSATWLCYSRYSTSKTGFDQRHDVLCIGRRRFDCFTIESG